MRLKALDVYFAFFEFTSMYEHLLSIYTYIIFWLFFRGFHEFLSKPTTLSARTCSGNARTCLQIEKMQSMHQGLSNALIPKYFGQKLAEITWFEYWWFLLKMSNFGVFFRFLDIGRIFYGRRIFWGVRKKFSQSEIYIITIAHLQNVNIFLSFDSVEKTSAPPQKNKVFWGGLTFFPQIQN